MSYYYAPATYLQSPQWHTMACAGKASVLCLQLSYVHFPMPGSFTKRLKFYLFFNETL